MRRLGLVFVIALLAGACGKKGPLIYPDLLVPDSPAGVTLRQTGPGMKLSFVLPSKDRAGRPLADLAGVKVLRREAMPDQGRACPACTDAFRLFRTMYVDVQDDSVRRYGSMMILLDNDVLLDVSYSYTLVPFTRQGVDGQGSAPVTATMTQPPLPPALRAIPAPTEIVLNFEGRPPVPGTYTVAGYNLYRSVKGQPLPFLPLNREPLPGNSYIDTGLDRRLTYSYGVRTVVRMPTGHLVESGLSNQVEAALKNAE
jgi:predicted small lipoprotein YifL